MLMVILQTNMNVDTTNCRASLTPGLISAPAISQPCDLGQTSQWWWFCIYQTGLGLPKLSLRLNDLRYKMSKTEPESDIHLMVGAFTPGTIIHRNDFYYI